MTKLIVTRTNHPERQLDEIELYPDNDTSRPRIGVLKFDKGRSNLVLDEGITPYRVM